MYELHVRRCYSHTARNNFFYADSLEDVSSLVRAIYSLAAASQDSSRLWLSIQIVDEPFRRYKPSRRP